MKFLIIGLGSMGKRRIRNLQSLKIGKIIGFDVRVDRRKETEQQYGIDTIERLEQVQWKTIDAMIVSTPPHIHNQYIALAINHKKPVFVEASVILEGLKKLHDDALKNKILIAPSCTMRFHPAIKDIKAMINSNNYGKVTNFSYHSGQYLPDWHPWEKVTDYYVSNKNTGAAREIVPFELTWLVDIVGLPTIIKGFYGKTMNVGADIDDTYVLILKYPNRYGTLTIDVVSRYATRSLIINMEQGQVTWNWNEKKVRLYDAQCLRWVDYHYPQGQTIQGYNQNIIEDMYIAEMDHFISAIKGINPFPNTLDADIKVLKLLYQAERYA